MLGWDVQHIIYDVTRKPCIAPKTVNILDENGLKIVNDASGQRVFKKDGTPRESGDTEKGYVLQTRIETPEEFANRLNADCAFRPEFYFARREVPILDGDVEEFNTQRLVIARNIMTTRLAEKRLVRREQAWARNVGDACNWCEFSSFCLQNINIDINNPPTGYQVGSAHPELETIA
jgi:hypothetical protein